MNYYRRSKSLGSIKTIYGTYVNNNNTITRGIKNGIVDRTTFSKGTLAMSVMI